MMEQFYFLYGVALIWIIAAVVQDIRTREVPNWLNFSLIGFVLAYRALYGILNNDLMFFVYGAIGTLLFVGLAYGLYYSRAFAGGDAKLLMGLGGIWPYQGAIGFVYYGIGFVLLLFVVGAVYSLVYTVFLAVKNKEKFMQEFKRQFVKYEGFFFVSVFFAVVVQAVVWFWSSDLLGLISVLLILIPLLFIYAKAFEKSCMINEVSADKLTEGDWLEENVKVGNRVIRKSVHGLNESDILFLRKNNKKVLIKAGIPFTPAFLFALVIMVYALKVLLF